VHIANESLSDLLRRRVDLTMFYTNITPAEDPSCYEDEDAARISRTVSLDPNLAGTTEAQRGLQPKALLSEGLMPVVHSYHSKNLAKIHKASNPPQQNMLQTASLVWVSSSSPKLLKLERLENSLLLLTKTNGGSQKALP
jgi:hypothetical protein